MTVKTFQQPDTLRDVALLDINDVRAAYRASKSWVYGQVAKGRLPAPVLRGARFARWRAADIRADLLRRAGEAALIAERSAGAAAAPAAAR